ncbi:MAG TPA: hypothetical protein PL182_10720 [Pseudobdellovibrionaceae bacterium]|nr:hypothetical protein [Pseudobdellovibrionaceae bacterium]
MRLTVFLMTIFLTTLANGKCFREHLQDAIALNTARAELYAALTEGASRDVSKRLIETERMMLRGTYVLDVDNMALRFDRAGIQVTCESYVSMNLVPDFRSEFLDGPVPESKDYDIKKLRISERLHRAFFSRDDAKLLAATQEILKVMKSEHRLYCLSRHLVESIARITALIPIHEAETRAKGVRSPRQLHLLMIRGHLALIERSRQIDEKAKPFNKAGIPLICQDVPPVPLPGNPSVTTN